MRYRLEVLSFLHVGSGTALGPLDFLVADERLWTIELGRVLSHPRVNPAELASLMGAPGFSWERYLRERRIPAPEVARHGVPCPVRPRGNVRQQARDPLTGRPYLPGSSLKGAIRTALLWAALEEPPRLAQAVGELRRQLGGRPRREWFAQSMERSALFGPSPNHDLLRALQVGDSTPFDEGRLRVEGVGVFSLRGSRLAERPTPRGGPMVLFAELLEEGATASVSIQVDEKVLGFPELQLSEKKRYVREWVQLCNRYARALAEAEHRFFSRYGPASAVEFYRGLLRRLGSLPPGAAVLCVGWSTGWEAKTVGDRIREADPQLFGRIRSAFRLGRRGLEPFPKTRRLCQGRPLGWLQLTPEA